MRPILGQLVTRKPAKGPSQAAAAAEKRVSGAKKANVASIFLSKKHKDSPLSSEHELDDDDPAVDDPSSPYEYANEDSDSGAATEKRTHVALEVPKIPKLVIKCPAMTPAKPVSNKPGPKSVKLQRDKAARLELSNQSKPVEPEGKEAVAAAAASAGAAAAAVASPEPKSRKPVVICLENKMMIRSLRSSTSSSDRDRSCPSAKP